MKDKCKERERGRELSPTLFLSHPIQQEEYTTITAPSLVVSPRSFFHSRCCCLYIVSHLTANKSDDTFVLFLFLSLSVSVQPCPNTDNESELAPRAARHTRWFILMGVLLLMVFLLLLLLAFYYSSFCFVLCWLNSIHKQMMIQSLSVSHCLFLSSPWLLITGFFILFVLIVSLLLLVQVCTANLSRWFCHFPSSLSDFLPPDRFGVNFMCSLFFHLPSLCFNMSVCVYVFLFRSHIFKRTSERKSL